MECRCQMASAANERPQRDGKMTKLARFLRRGHKARQPDEPREPIDLYERLRDDDWDSILSSRVEDEDIFVACERAVKENDMPAALKLLFVTSDFLQFPRDQCSGLCRAWVFMFTEVLTNRADMATAMDMLVHAEMNKRFNGEKMLLNLLITALLSFPTPSTGTSLAQQVVDWCQKEGMYSFAFDIALNSGHFQEAYSILTTMKNVSKEHVMMLQDVASQSQFVSCAKSFVDFCLLKGSSEFAFSLASRLKLWTVIKEEVEAGVRSPSLLRQALSQCVVEEKWDIAHVLLGHLSENDVREELISIPKPYNVSTVTDLLVEFQFVPAAIQLACSFGRPGKAAQIIQETGFVMDSALSVSVANACFDNHCSPEEFLGIAWDKDLLKHILEAPRQNPFSENQWKCVLKFLDTGLPREIVTELIKRAVEEDAACLDHFIDRGVDNALMEIVLTHEPEKYLSENHLNCVVKLLYKEAGIDLKGLKNVLTGEAVLSAQTRNEDMITTREADRLVLQRTDSVHKHSDEQGPSRQAVSQPEEDWSTAVLLIQGHSTPPWWYVMRAAQVARRSHHIRQLAIRAAQEGLWNCLICLAIQGLHQHPLDLLLPLLHEHPETLVYDYLLQKEQQLLHRDIWCFQEGWKEFRHDIDILNLHSRDLLEERHKMILLGKALATRDWGALMSFSFIDLPLPTRRAIFRKAMEHQQWLLAGEMFQQIPDKAKPLTFQTALKELTPTSEQLYKWMVENGLYSAYLAPEMFAHSLEQLDEKEATPRQAENTPKPKSPMWKRFLKPKPKPKPSHGFQRPNKAVTAEEKDEITSTQGEVVQSAAVKGDWGLVMKVYEGGMGEAVKTAVLQEAQRQDRWSVLAALIRRDPEADIFYTPCARGLLEEAVGHGAWYCVEVLVERLCTEDDRDWLFPFALGLARWSLVLTLVKRGVRAQFRKEALLTAAKQNEWMFVVDYTLHIVQTSPEELSADMKIAVIQSLTRMAIALQPSPPGPSTFGLDILFPTKDAEGGQGHGQGQGQDDGAVRGSVEERGEGRGGQGEVEEGGMEEWKTDDGTTVLQVAARMRLWTVCKVLLHCGGANPRPSPTPSHPHDVILLALHDDQLDVLHMLLDYDVTTDVIDQALRELLLTPYLNLRADVGISLLRKLLDKRRKSSSSAKEETLSSVSADVITESSGVISDVSDDVAMLLLEQVSEVLERSKARTFQASVSQAVEHGQLRMPSFLSGGQRIRRGEGKRGFFFTKRGGGSGGGGGCAGVVAADSGSAVPPVGPRVCLRVEKAPRATPVARLLSSSSFVCPPPPLLSPSPPAAVSLPSPSPSSLPPPPPPSS
ncbi:uncharacterized protein LOC143275981 [Babylonia areolata]|uniref:uncharacterized protein LOC143275981 n=1 Tax=Babylonia areolata TaxID=304850 RepID=UPI003FD313C0